MLDQEHQTSSGGNIINIRKLAALDLVFHGSRLVLAEFAIAVIVCGSIGIFNLFAFFRNPNHSLFTLIIGLILCWIGLNYVPLLLYAISIVRGKSAQQEVAFELEHKEIYARKYTLQSMWLLLLTLVIPILSLMQERQKRSHHEH
ncbi:hypothetical protein [Dictyobacter arantiisoli]|uniref:Uncharacterized protein n=1 Tax=Dictyobacter arantiisoli TaxID=2014874 RepID=A0A5A5TI48_9CHLR|nr:hypothetical protein [Dictyobacter arantiisoli]GCF10992.1 hypothetical protein KDI_45560 [Dictyobacter arantiisoli]